MAYYLTIKRKNDYQLLDISKLEEFTKNSRYKNGGFSLEEIDNCTMKFYNEYFFKEALYKAGLISLEDIARDITIRCKNKEELTKVRYGLAYQDSKNYLDVYGLKFILLSKQKDKNFLEKLLSYYRNSYINNINISKIKYAMNMQDDELLNVALGDFYMREVTKLDTKTGEAKLNYKPFHDLAMLIYNYDKNIMREKCGITTEEAKIERELTFEYLKKSLNGSLPVPEVSSEPKKKTKTKVLEGQISIF